MQRREFITAAVGMAATVASASQAFAQDYPDAGTIKKMPVGEGAAGAAKKGIEGEAGAAKKVIIETITEAIGGGEMEEMHPPKYKALEDAASIPTHIRPMRSIIPTGEWRWRARAAFQGTGVELP